MEFRYATTSKSAKVFLPENWKEQRKGHDDPQAKCQVIRPKEETAHNSTTIDPGLQK